MPTVELYWLSIFIYSSVCLLILNSQFIPSPPLPFDNHKFTFHFGESLSVYIPHIRDIIWHLSFSITLISGFTGGSHGKGPACNAGWRRSPGGGNCYSLRYSCLEMIDHNTPGPASVSTLVNDVG